MKTTRSHLCLALMLIGLGWATTAAQAVPPVAAAVPATVAPVAASAPALPGPEARAPFEFESTDRLPGVDLAEGISTVTGVAISPLLGVGATGAWRYWQTPEAHRGSLPWYCHPAVWGTIAVLLAACFFKDAIGPVLPPMLKKPFDVLELLENKLSAVVVAGGFLPFLVAQMVEHLPVASDGGGQALVGASLPVAAAMPVGARLEVMLNVVGWMVAVSMFFVVWMLSHAVNVLILLSPFGALDAALKLLRLGVLGAILGAFAINPYLGASLSLLIVLVSAWWAGAALRLTVFGTVACWDLIRFGFARRSATPSEVHAVTARRFAGLPVLVYGRLKRGAGSILTFEYRPWFVLSRRTLTVPGGPAILERGWIFPTVLHPRRGSSHRTSFIVMPRYRNLESMIGEQLGISTIRDCLLTRGMKAIWRSLVDMIRGWRQDRAARRAEAMERDEPGDPPNGAKPAVGVGGNLG